MDIAAADCGFGTWVYSRQKGKKREERKGGGFCRL